MSRARRERQFKDTLNDLYDTGKVEIFYTGRMPPWVGTESYWRGHGFKVPAKDKAVGIHAIYSLLLLTPAYALRDVSDLKGELAAARRLLFFCFHQLTETQKHDHLWRLYCEPQFEMGEWGYQKKLAEAFNAEQESITEQRAAIGAMVWRIFRDQQRGKWYAMWRIGHIISEQLDAEFRAEVYEKFGWLPEDLHPNKQAEGTADDIPF